MQIYLMNFEITVEEKKILFLLSYEDIGMALPVNKLMQLKSGKLLTTFGKEKFKPRKQKIRKY